MLTITAHPNAHKSGPIYTLKNLLRGWGRLYQRLKRYNNGAFEYIRVFEVHPDGLYHGYHMHVVCDMGASIKRHMGEYSEVLRREERAINQGKKPRKRLKKEIAPSRWLKNNSANLGMGHQCEITMIGVNPQKAALYQTKYITKQIEILEFPHRARRIQTSRRLAPKKKQKTGNVRNWYAKSAIYMEDVLKMDRIYDMTAKHIINLEDDFSKGELWYPPELK